jgi:hypothetical protein
MVNSATVRSERGKKLSGEAPSPGFRSWFSQILQKISLICQINSPQPRRADSSSRDAVSFSSARTMNRFPSLRSASKIQIVVSSRHRATRSDLSTVENVGALRRDPRSKTTCVGVSIFGTRWRNGCNSRAASNLSRPTFAFCVCKYGSSGIVMSRAISRGPKC